MTDLVYSLIGGAFVYAALFIGLYKFTRLGGKSVGGILAFIVIGTYIPFAILNWPGADVFAIHLAIYLVTVYILGIITHQHDNTERKEGESWFHWGPMTLVIFFLVIVTVDSVLLLVATKGVDSEVAQWLFPKPASSGDISSHFPGTVARDYRQKYEEMNAYRERMEAQQKRGWQVKRGWLNEAVNSKPAVFKVQVLDKQGQPIQKAKIVGEFLRPGNDKLDVRFSMQELTHEAGSYQVTVVLPAPGKWDLHLVVDKDGLTHELHASTTIN